MISLMRSPELESVVKQVLQVKLINQKIKNSIRKIQKKKRKMDDAKNP